MSSTTIKTGLVFSALVAVQLPAHALEFTGYLRGGLGESSGSGSQRCFKLQGHNRNIASATSASSMPSCHWSRSS